MSDSPTHTIAHLRYSLEALPVEHAQQQDDGAIAQREAARQRLAEPRIDGYEHDTHRTGTRLRETTMYLVSLCSM